MIYLDANVIIRLIEGDTAARAPIEARLQDQTLMLTSQLSRLECRCLPLRNSNQRLLALYDAFFRARELRVIELTAAVIDRATDLRARHGFRTPDALHLAAAIVSGASSFLTGDRQLTRCTEISVETV